LNISDQSFSQLICTDQRKPQLIDRHCRYQASQHGGID
jgi:hypothetical protein